MPQRNLQKVQKHISKKRGAIGAMHENSRDAQRLRRAGARDERLIKHNANVDQARRPYLDRIRYFYEAVQTIENPLSDTELAEIVTKYINRDEEEMAQLQQERRKGRPPTRREEALTQRTQTEEKEFKTGFWMPDLSDADVLIAVKHWNRQWSGLSPLKFIRLTQEGTKQTSSFPPKSIS
ncbi:hypothetical protein PENDEC_c003G02697 [Penicillium decumbens]|uniref:Translation machinery-associated protein 16 n=1 Tax=Penicillium decumbens TaxID=69771 RepID=A0A1V6PJT4_PENDC|nr:hypothetical protein PENDEC_c003G02697 [Penicillium decumbens]